MPSDWRSRTVALWSRIAERRSLCVSVMAPSAAVISRTPTSSRANTVLPKISYATPTGFVMAFASSSPTAGGRFAVSTTPASTATSPAPRATAIQR